MNIHIWSTRVWLAAIIAITAIVGACGNESVSTTGGTTPDANQPRIPTFEEAARRASAISNYGVPNEESVETLVASYELRASRGGFSIAAECENYRNPAWWTEWVLGMNPESDIRSAVAECPHVLDEIAEAAAEGMGGGAPGDTQTPLEAYQEMIAQFDALADQAVEL